LSADAKDNGALLDSKEWEARLFFARNGAARFAAASAGDGPVARLTPTAEASDYARCFYVFLAHTLGFPLMTAPPIVGDAIRRAIRRQRQLAGQRFRDKPFRQLLTFSLSALHVLGELKADPLEDLVLEQLPRDVGQELEGFGCFDGVVGTGNQAMFLAIFLLHARNELGVDTQLAIDDWVGLHLRHMNRFGFWGDDRWMTHLQFQNGYHQHEILEYLGVDNPRWQATAEAVRGLVDAEGHFAPYPGGGGCFDYDAVFMLTPHRRISDDVTRNLLQRTARTLLMEQNSDGGFCESHRVRPQSLENLSGFARHIWAARHNPGALRERLRYGLTLQRSRHDRIYTHWSRYSRRWNESDLWDSWFRILALARIDVALYPERKDAWGFINYPGIGFHPHATSSA
jgi:hypothetical protein